ncbi:MAG TPA: GntR family transcriptional regulator, partial [Chroococcidiopsis sp.]
MDLTISLDAHIATPLHQQLYDEIRAAILKGRLQPRQRIPSTRSLAKTLGVSRTTVTQGYEQLHSEGYLETIVGSGTYVCAQLPDDLLHSAPIGAAPPSTTAAIALSQRGDRIHQSAFRLQAEPTCRLSFRYGRPALDQFPMALWRKLLLRHCRSAMDWMDYATDFQGHRPL